MAWKLGWVKLHITRKAYGKCHATDLQGVSREHAMFERDPDVTSIEKGIRRHLRHYIGKDKILLWYRAHQKTRLG